MLSNRTLLVAIAIAAGLLTSCSKKNEVSVGGQACAEDSECPDDGNPCTEGTCVDGACSYSQKVADGTPAEGGGRCYKGQLPCTGCWDKKTASCLPGNLIDLCGDEGALCTDCRNDGTACNTDSCVDNQCKHVALAPDPDGGNPTPDGCSGSCWGEVCCGGCWDTMASVCKQGQSDLVACGLGGSACKSCDDGNPCTVDSCDDGVCNKVKVNVADGTPCPDGACNAGVCCKGCVQGSSCTPGTANESCGAGGEACSTCVQSNPCMESTCQVGGCSTPQPLDGVSCPTGVCVQGQCQCGSAGEPCCASGDACQSGLACEQGTCGGCGATGKPCCPVGEACSAGNVCQSGSCTACGGVDQPCCGAASCQAGTVCVTDQCKSCGGPNQPCCQGNICEAGNNCSGSQCLPCGGLNQACCLSGAACSSAGVVCSNTSCVSCGSTGEPCCAGGACGAWSDCSSNSCTACGKAGEACCTGATACDDYLACSASSCRGCVTQMAVGNDHRCAIRSDGTLWCWGQNSNGQLGTGDTSGKGEPTQITSQGVGEVVQVAAGTGRTAVRKADGSVWNLAATTTQIAFGAGATAIDVAAGGDFSCARVTEGAATTIRCWTSGGSAVSTVTLPGSRTAADITIGGHHACAAATDGTAWCWGQNESGQLGSGNTTPSATTPVQVTWLSGSPSVSQLAAGNAFTCAVTADKKTWCWGNSGSYQVGTGSTTAANPYPLEVTALGTQATSIAAGRAHACVLTGSKALWCWGANTSGQAGPGGANPMQTPTQVAFFGSAVASNAAGGNESCVIRSDGTAWCFGSTPQRVPISCP